LKFLVYLSKIILFQEKIPGNVTLAESRIHTAGDKPTNPISFIYYFACRKVRGKSFGTILLPLRSIIAMRPLGFKNLLAGGKYATLSLI
jgi:hypothetical protein